MSDIWVWIFSEAGLPVVFLALMGLSMLVYAILDGYDLGVGILMLVCEEPKRDRMIASIGPFWDANETWLVLGVGILLVAFPVAHGVVLGTLYLPVAFMLIGLILRGVSFDFRAKARVSQKKLWDRLFGIGSLLAATTQGYMLGQYIVGFSTTAGGILFSLVSAACVTAAYSLMGACWLVLKTTDDLRSFAIACARRFVPLVTAGLVLVSVVNPLVSDRIYVRWFAWPEVILLALLPVSTLFLLYRCWSVLGLMEQSKSTGKDGLPFAMLVGVFVLSFTGLAYSFFPYVIPGELTVWEAASAAESLRIILWGCIVVLPTIAAYTVLSYWIFRGKARELNYF